ncbi:hypothetical protein SAMN04488074_13649 [Lentzea albidocapillata subsp. violacea]|uniref:Uncharacterized protein n=1 Tax=Lentzea albidocapillata subsp. violacea TaxID=128104 RepID=A0A1G9YZZ8_9PSEU|nr:hypothetical protein [Lentzea albidocapillata]SDN14729.1 hypothetical protein SAMN04488074_13649 [Lentzea albidocapillata subsp. violacea]
MSGRVLGALAARHDLGEANTLEEAVLAHLGPTADAHDVEAIVNEYLEALNAVLDPVGLYIEDDEVFADGRVDVEDVNTEIDDAFFRVDLAVIAARHWR